MHGDCRDGRRAVWRVLRPHGLRRQSHGNEARQNHQRGKEHLRNSRNERCTPRRTHRVGGHCALHNQEVRAPVAERKHEAESEHKSEPIHAEGIRAGAAHARPRVRVRGRQPRLESFPAADVLQAEPHQRQKSGDDQEKLQDFVVNRAAQAAEQNVNEHDDRGNHHAEIENPVLRDPEFGEGRVENVQNLNQARHCVHGNARGKNRHDREGDRIESARLFVKAQPQVLRHGTRPRAVVKRHHENADEDHSRDGTHPVEMARRDSIFRAGRGHANHFLRSEIGRDEGEAAYPGRDGAPSQKKVRARLHAPPQHKSDAQHGREIHQHDDPIDSSQVHRTPWIAAGMGGFLTWRANL